MNAEVLESYLIPEPATEMLEVAAVGAACIAAIGITGAVMGHKRKVKNRQTRQEVENYLSSKGIDGSSDMAIKSYQDKLISDMIKTAQSGVQKIISNAKFKATSEQSIYKKLQEVKSRMEEYDDNVSNKKWLKYVKGSLRFKLNVDGMHHDALTFVDPNSPLIQNLFDEEDNDDNAPEYFDEVTGEVCRGIGNAVCADLEKQFSEDIGTGLVEVSYMDMFNSPWGVPAIQLTPKKIPCRNGKMR